MVKIRHEGCVHRRDRHDLDFRADDWGQVSFSLVATVLLLSTVVAGAYLAKREMDEASARDRARLLEAMVSAVDDVSLELSLAAAARAQDIVSRWSSYPVNGSEISMAFSHSMEEYVEHAFPREEHGFGIGIANWTGGLLFSEMNTIDLVASDKTSNETVELEGQSMTYNELPSGNEEILQERTVTPYYVAVGEFSVRIASATASFSKNASFQRPVVSPLPFIESKLRAFRSASLGAMSDLGKAVASMLTTLAQLRVLEGAGSPLRSDVLVTGDILTERDVYRAIAVGLLLEQARLFRCVDLDYAEQVVVECGGGDLALRALTGSNGRYADPGELFLWFLGRTEPRVDPTSVVASAVEGIIDQLAVKLMDYMGWLGVLDFTDDLIDKVADSLDSLMAYLTGEDKAHEAVVSWLENAMRLVDADPIVYAEVFSAESDCFVYVPERVYFVEDVEGNLHPVWIGNFTVVVDLPEYDLLEPPIWREFYDEFKENQQSLRGVLYDCLRRLAHDIATQTLCELDAFVVDPFDDEDLFTTLSAASGDVALLADASALCDSVRTLPMFSSQCNTASELSAFASEHISELFGDELMSAAASNLVETLLERAQHQYIPDLVVPVEQQLEDIVANDVSFDPAWGVMQSMEQAVLAIGRVHLDRFLHVLNSSVARADDGFSGPLVDMIALALVSGVDGCPGFARLIESALSCATKAVLAQRNLACHKRSVFLDLDAQFDFWEGNLSSATERDAVLSETLSIDVVDGLKPMTAVPFDPDSGYDCLRQLIPIDEVLVQVKRPWNYDRSEEEYPNTHLTSLLNVTATPYATQWEVSVRAYIRIVASSSSSALDSLYGDSRVESERVIDIDLCLPIVVHSSTPLNGVEYNPTNTALSDAIAAARLFCNIVWDQLEPVVSWIRDGFDRVVWFLQDFFDVVASFATRLVKCVATGVQTLVETIQKYIQTFADSVLGKAVKLLIDMTGTIEVRISLYGFTITVRTNLPDLLFRDARDLLRIMVHSRHLGPGITFGVRVAQLSDGRYDLIVNGTLTTDDFSAEIVIDPLMQVKRRFAELHVKARSWALDLSVPEVEPYELAEASTSDLPGLGAMMSNIPLPMFGMSASVDLGMRVKYSPPFATNLVVNEFEANPTGDDNGKEWVELYNPLADEVALDGWRLETIHGSTRSIDLSGSVPPGGYAVFTFRETSIDNGQTGDPFNDGDAIALVDSNGDIVDLTPMLSDTANDPRSHQRNWDGGPKWSLRDCTKADSNGVPTFIATADYIAKALFEAFKEAFEETKTAEVSASLEFLRVIGKRILSHFIDNLLDIVKEIIQEVVFYVEATLSDATGAAGAGFRVSFVVKGEAISELLKWIIKSIATYLVNLGRVGNPVEYPSSPAAFFANLHIRFEMLFFVGMPRMLTALGANVDLDRRVAAVVSIGPNLPAIGRLAGMDWGAWAVDFGLRIERVPREIVGTALIKASGDLIDIWLVRARAYGI
ncbi:MAG: lamin tail domain-containing protein [Methanobacteriota archaeon]|nr:MAG: lamin tail domain-containing protein [Euryarchaeota archaeon]